MLVYLKEFTVRLDDITKVVPASRENGGTYVYVKHQYGVDREYTKHDYQAVIEAIRIVESRRTD